MWACLLVLGCVSARVCVCVSVCAGVRLFVCLRVRVGSSRVVINLIRPMV